jgi:hypothetical protein
MGQGPLEIEDSETYHKGTCAAQRKGSLDQSASRHKAGQSRVVVNANTESGIDAAVAAIVQSGAMHFLSDLTRFSLHNAKSW